jgi:hypothetical protein
MASATPEQARAGMEAWQAWAAKAGSAIVDLGAPVSGEGDISGFSILETGSRGELDELLAEHPHRGNAGCLDRCVRVSRVAGHVVGQGRARR